MSGRVARVIDARLGPWVSPLHVATSWMLGRYAAWWARASPRKLSPRISLLVALLLWLARPLAADGAAAGSVGALERAALAAPDKACRGVRLDGQGLARFYSAATPMLLWVDEGGLGLRGRQLRAALERADDEGLPAARYGLAGIEAYGPASTPAELACLDLMLTAAFERYARDLGVGWIAPREADRTWHLPAAAFDPVTTLQAIAQGADIGTLSSTGGPVQEVTDVGGRSGVGVRGR